MKLFDVKKQEPVTLDFGNNTQLQLSFDFNAFAEIEEQYGSIDEAMKLVEQGKFKPIQFVIWAGLQAHAEEITLKQVGSMIDLSNMKSLMEALTTAFSGSLPDDDGSKTDPNE